MKVVAILLVLLPVVAVFALRFRRHYSRYKDGTWVVPRIAGRLQKLEVLYGRALEDATRQYIERRLRVLLVGLGLLWILGLGVLLLPEEEKETGQIPRPAAEEDAAGVRVQLSDGESATEVELTVESRDLTEEEFAKAADDAERELEKEIYGENRASDYVTGDLVFPEKDRTGKLQISWDTDTLTVIGRTGTVRREELESPCVVEITATLTDGIRTRQAEYTATVIPAKDTETVFQRALRSLTELEESSRGEAVFRLPEEVDGVRVTEQKKSGKKTICTIYLGVVLVAGALFLLRENKQKEMLKDREERLQHVFYRFVKRLTLLLGAGESLQGSLVTAAAVEERYLTPEVQYAVNRIRTGSAEPAVYADLGRSLGLQTYVRLFSTISTAAPRGSSQLLGLLEQEVKDAEAEAKESARRRGEQAAQKLLLPMILLMIVVIGIVLFPAVVGM